MGILENFLNPMLIVPACAWCVAQIIKAIVNAIVNKKFSFDRLFGDGGMPSGHSATVTSLAIMVGLMDKGGFTGAPFAVATIFAIVVMHDALGVRREAGKHAVSIIGIAEVLNNYFSERDEHIKTDKLKVLVGHTPLQVVCGALLGLAVAVLYYFIAIV